VPVPAGVEICGNRTDDNIMVKTFVDVRDIEDRMVVPAIFTHHRSPIITASINTTIWYHQPNPAT
jgi:hypothetical protein